MRYIPNSPAERRAMLEEIGCERIEELFEQIPDNLRLTEALIGPATHINEHSCLAAQPKQIAR